MKVMLNKQVVDKELEWIQFLVAFKLVTDTFAVFLDDILHLRMNSLELLELQILYSVHKLELTLVKDQTYSFMELRKEQKMVVHKKLMVGLQMEQMMVQGKEKESWKIEVMALHMALELQKEHPLEPELELALEQQLLIQQEVKLHRWHLDH